MNEDSSSTVNKLLPSCLIMLITITIVSSEDGGRAMVSYTMSNEIEEQFAIDEKIRARRLCVLKRVPRRITVRLSSSVSNALWNSLSLP